MRSRSVPVRVALVLAAVASLTPLSPTVVAQAAGAASATVTPRTGLSDPFSDGQYVTVQWRGFPPGALVGAKECVHGATSLSQCSRGSLYSSCGYLCPGDWILGTSDKHGSGSGSLPVANGLVNVDQDRQTPLPGYTFRCDSEHPCDLWVSPNKADISKGVFIPVEFQPPADACAGSGGASLSGSGPAGGIRQLMRVAIEVCKPPDNLDLEYVWPGKVSQTAIDDYIAGFSDFAISSLPMNALQRTQLDTAGRTAGFAPILGSGEVFAFRMFDDTTLNQLTKLTLTPELLARIFSGQIKNWNIPAIKKLNPGTSLPNVVTAIGRGDSCEESLNVTRWFWSTARDAWRDGGRGVPPAINPYTGPSDILPSLATSFNPVNLVTGAPTLANIVRTGGPDFASITQYGLIGYMDSSIAEQYGLPTVRIKYPNGKTVAATPSSIRRGIAAMRRSDGGVASPDYNTQAANQWPMPVVSYMVIPHGAKDSEAPPEQETGDRIADLVRLMVGGEQQRLAAGYVPLPPEFVAQARTMANQIWNAPPEPLGGGDHIPGGDGLPPGGDTFPAVGGGTGVGGGSVAALPGDTSVPTGTTTQPSSSQPQASEQPTVPGLVLPQSALASTPWSKALPTATIFGLASLIVGAYLLFGQRVRAGASRSAAKMRQVSPLKRHRGVTPDRPDEGTAGA